MKTHKYWGIIFLFVNCTLLADDFSFTQSGQLNAEFELQLKKVWETGKFSNFKGINKVTIEYASFQQKHADQCLIISPGRTEGYLKYQELILDLQQFNINLFIIDHRGQGLSSKVQKNQQKGYVKDFDYYADDLNQFVSEIVKKECINKPIKILAHSMGSAIALRMMQKYPNAIHSALLASPMIAINRGGVPIWLVKSIIYGGQTLNHWFCDQAWYFLGQGDYRPKSFKENPLTHSKIRFNRFIKLNMDQPKLQLGGVTFQWLAESLEANSEILENIKNRFFGIFERTNSLLFIDPIRNFTKKTKKWLFSFFQKLNFFYFF